MSAASRKIGTAWAIGRGIVLWGLVLLLVLGGCGESDGRQPPPESSARPVGSASTAAASDRPGPLKETQWGVSEIGARSVQISAFVPYCGKPHAEPYVERIVRRRASGRVVLTMMVRYPPAQGACVGEDISVMRWIAVRGDPRALTFYDGSTSPPTKRPLG
jgi:hypothetical protein